MFDQSDGVQTNGRDPVPGPVQAFGLLGLIPFVAPPAIALASPEWKAIAYLVQADYAALILSFLGGVRWAFAVARPNPSSAEVARTMAPTLTAFAILIVFSHRPGLELWMFAAALTAQWLWDRRLADAPAWFATLRTPLTLGAVAGLLAEAWLIG